MGRERGVTVTFFFFSRPQTPHGQCNCYNRNCLRRRLVSFVRNGVYNLISQPVSMGFPLYYFVEAAKGCLCKQVQKIKQNSKMKICLHQRQGLKVLSANHGEERCVGISHVPPGPRVFVLGQLCAGGFIFYYLVPRGFRLGNEWLQWEHNSLNKNKNNNRIKQTKQYFSNGLKLNVCPEETYGVTDGNIF